MEALVWAWKRGGGTWRALLVALGVWVDSQGERGLPEFFVAHLGIVRPLRFTVGHQTKDQVDVPHGGQPAPLEVMVHALEPGLNGAVQAAKATNHLVA